MRPHPLTILVAVGAILGFYFASTSTFDFVAHLDRQVHGIHCGFLPGASSVDATGASGCHVTMMSPYSSVFRQGIWGGIPIALPAMAVFGFILFWTLALILLKRQDDRKATGFLLLATGVPIVASIVMGSISFGTLGAACKVCIGIYISSLLVFVGALLLWLRARKASALSRVPDPHAQTVEAAPAPMSTGALIAAFFVGLAMVAVATVAYAAAAPDYSDYVGACGSLEQPKAPPGVLVPLGSQQGVEAVEVLDPLCPACRGFERRLDASGLHDELARKALLFPLDNECNWMVDSAIHAGACSVSEALLCAEGPQRDAVLEWAFDNQEDIRAAAEKDPKAAERLVVQKFPGLKRCVGRPAVRAKLNRGLRWAVANQLPVLTPQLYVKGVRLCDEDSDLGMDYALSHMISRAREGTLRSEKP